MTRYLTVTRKGGSADVAELRLRGRWLHDAGFRPGKRVRVDYWVTAGGLSIISLWARYARKKQTKTKP